MRVSRVLDVFNGDADGIIARHQYRLVHPAASTFITGVKRDTALLDQLASSPDINRGEQLFVFDISYDANHMAATALLARDINITWFDHHRADHFATHSKLQSHIDTSADICSSLIVDGVIGGAYRHWAIAATYGDNLIATADSLARQARLSDHQRRALQRLGEAMNYNAYGEVVEDLHIAPATLAAQLSAYASPFDFIESETSFITLTDGFAADIALTTLLKPEYVDNSIAAYVLPDTAWARRVSGTFANRCAHNFPKRAHAIATPNRSGTYSVSIRAPLDNARYADDVAMAFGGGGRKAAAGINALSQAKLDPLINLMRTTYRG